MDIAEHMQHQKELADRRKAWEEQRKAEAEQRARQEKQARMEAWLQSRRQAWTDHTGSLPPAGMVEGWKADYITERATEQEWERAARLALAEDIAAGS